MINDHINYASIIYWLILNCRLKIFYNTNKKLSYPTNHNQSRFNQNFINYRRNPGELSQGIEN